MTKYLIRRFLVMIVVLWVVSVITFALMRVVPGGPFDRERPLPEQTIQYLNERYNLDDPVLKQYVDYLTNIIVPRITEDKVPRSESINYLITIDLPGDSTLRWMDFGPSYRSRTETVSAIISRHLPISAQLGAAAMLVAVVIGIPAGTIAALRRNSPLDYFSMGIAIVGVSIPTIVSGPVLQYIFGVRLQDTPLELPVTGWGELQHVILPAFALGFAQSAILARLTRASLLQVLHADYIRTARAKGLAESRVITLHALKNSMIPVVTVLGPLFAFLITGSFVTETIFGINGLGRFFITSITNRNYPVIMGTTLIFAAIIVIANALVDVVYALLDPRIQYD